MTWVLGAHARKMIETGQSQIDQRNIAFWNTLCGTNLAQTIGVTDRSAASLEKFDKWFFAHYPYLDHYIPFAKLTGRMVLEVGLGYGSVAERLATHGAEYTGLDIAVGPVEVVNYRMELKRLNGRALRGSILTAPFSDQVFDAIIAIGCYHHTGDLQGAIDESFRLLKPGGTLVCMVYNALSYRRWYTSTRATLKYYLTSGGDASTNDERAAYDRHPDGSAAPHTSFVSRAHLRRMCRRFSRFSARLENITDEPPFARWSRDRLLDTTIPHFLGLDIYAVAVK